MQWRDVLEKATIAKELYQRLAESYEEDVTSSSEGEEFDEDNNDSIEESFPKSESDQQYSQPLQNGMSLTDNESISSSFLDIDSGIENGLISEVSSMSIDNGQITDDGDKGSFSEGDR